MASGPGNAPCAGRARAQNPSAGNGNPVPYQPIEDYGIIGNLKTAALIGKNGSLDWMCYPRFDSPSIFGSILDEKKGGYFRIKSTAENVVHRQLYWPDTNVLVTRFLSADGVG